MKIRTLPRRLRLAVQQTSHLVLVASLLSLIAWTPEAGAADIQMTHPVGGWRADVQDGDGQGSFMQEVHYPAVRVNVAEGTPIAAQIRGRIASRAGAKPRPRDGRRSQEPATLVVNGLAMPLQTDELGQFARPYAFAAGSNSVEVRADSRAPRRVQFLDTSARSRPRLRILLSWDTSGTDLDLHVISPSGQHAWYGQRVIADGGALDVDVTDGYGPEIFASPRPERGNWHVFVNYFGGWGDSASLSTAQVVIIDGEGTASETRREYRVPLRASGDLLHVVSFGVN